MMNRSHGIRALLLLLLSTSSYAATLPIYKVQASQKDDATVVKLAQSLFSIPSPRVSRTATNTTLVKSADGLISFEYDPVSGGFWGADTTLLYNHTATPKLADNATTVRLATQVAGSLGLLPVANGVQLVDATPRVGGTWVAQETETTTGVYTRVDKQLDVSVTFGFKVNVSSVVYPVVGGAKVQLSYGDGGKLAGVNGVWRNIVDTTGTQYTLIPQATADAQFLKNATLLGTDIKFKSSIAYLSSPFGEFQDFLYPVYLYEGNVTVEREVVELTRTYIPATVYAPKDTFVPEPVPTTRSSKKLRPRTADDRVYEAGIYWLGLPYGLTQSQQNAQKFKTQLQASTTQSWNINFHYGNALCWASDWNANDESYVDAVDILFYSGQANRNGWMANYPGDAGPAQLVSYSIVGTQPANPGDLWGQQDLEWLAISGSGPLQDFRFLPGAGNAFDRWRGAFDGLHQLLGFGSAVHDVNDQGRRFVKYAQDGEKLIDAWFHAAKDMQPYSVIVAAMWTSGSGGDSRNDHLPGYGTVSTDNLVPSQTRWLMWTHC